MCHTHFCNWDTSFVLQYNFKEAFNSDMNNNYNTLTYIVQVLSLHSLVNNNMLTR